MGKVTRKTIGMYSIHVLLQKPFVIPTERILTGAEGWIFHILEDGGQPVGQPQIPMITIESVVVYFFFEKHVSIPMVNSSRVLKMAMIFHNWMAYPIRLDNSAFMLCSNLPLPSSSPVFQLGVSENSVPRNPMVNDHYPY